MAYFGDTLSHAALLGVAVGFLLDVSPTLTVTVGCLALAVVLVVLQRVVGGWPPTPCSASSPTAPCHWGLVALSFMHEVRIDLMSYLFGDLLAVGPAICAGSLAAAPWCWSPWPACGGRCWPSPCTRNWPRSKACR